MNLLTFAGADSSSFGRLSSTSSSSSSGSSSGSSEDPLAPPTPEVGEDMEFRILESTVSAPSPQKAPLLSSSADQNEDQVHLSYKPRTTSRLGGSCRFVLVGAALLLSAMTVLLVSENHAVANRQYYQDLHQRVHEIKLDENNPKEMYGLVHVSGTVQTTGTLQDETFGVSPSNLPLKLYRYAQMYQWVESEDINTKTGYYDYTLEWDSTYNDSEGFEESSHPSNPAGGMPYPPQVFTATPLTIGSGSSTLTLSTSVADKLSAYEVYKNMQIQDIPDDTLRQKATLEQDPEEGPFIYIRGGDDNQQDSQRNPAQNPIVGDSRVQFRVVAPQTFSILAYLDGDSTLMPFEESWYGRKRTLVLVAPGQHSANEMLQHAQKMAQRHLGVIRFVCGMLVYLGILILGKPASVLEDAVPQVRDLVGPGFRLGIAAARLLPVAFCVTFTAIALVWGRVHFGWTLLVLIAEGLAVYCVGKYLMEWWGHGPATNGGSNKNDKTYQLVDDQTFMELKEV